MIYNPEKSEQKSYRNWTFDDSKCEWVWHGFEIEIEHFYKGDVNEYVMIYAHRNGIIRSSANIYPDGSVHGAPENIKFIAETVLDFGAFEWEHEYHESLNIPENLLRNLAESYLTHFEWDSVSWR